MHLPDNSAGQLHEYTPLAGLVFHCQRADKLATISVALKFRERPKDACPPAFDVKLTLAKLWRYADSPATPPGTTHDDADAGPGGPTRHGLGSVPTF